MLYKSNQHDSLDLALLPTDASFSRNLGPFQACGKLCVGIPVAGPRRLKSNLSVLGRFSVHFCTSKRFKNGRVFLDPYVKDDVSLSISNASSILMKLRRNHRETHKMYHAFSRQICPYFQQQLWLVKLWVLLQPQQPLPTNPVPSLPFTSVPPRIATVL